MKIDRVIFAWDGNPNYAGLYELQRKVWGKLGIKTVLAWVSNDECPFQGGDIDVLRPASELHNDVYPKRNWQATMGLLWESMLWENETVMTSGIDQIPLSRRFIDSIYPLSWDSMVIGFAGVGYNYPTSHVAAESVAFRRLFKKVGLFEDFVRRADSLNLEVQWPSVSHRWGYDESFFAHCIAVSTQPIVKFGCEFFDKWNADRIGRNRPPHDNEKLTRGEYSELHCSAPPSEMDLEVIDTILDLL